MPDVEDPPPTEASPLVTPARNGGANPSPVSTAASSAGGDVMQQMVQQMKVLQMSCFSVLRMMCWGY